MFYYIDQPRTPSFPIGLVETESDVIVTSVETGLGRSTLVVAVISVDAHPFYFLYALIFLCFCSCNSMPCSRCFSLAWSESQLKKILFRGGIKFYSSISINSYNFNPHMHEMGLWGTK